MMTEVLEHRGAVMERHAKAIEVRCAGEPAWLRSIRERAQEQFAKAGYPTTRDEEWKFTNVGPITKTNFHIPHGAIPSLSSQQVAGFTIPDLNSGVKLVFVNGRYAPKLS